jgi:hypothetical protein
LECEIGSSSSSSSSAVTCADCICIFRDAYGFDINARRLTVQKKKILHWIDLTDVAAETGKNELAFRRNALNIISVLPKTLAEWEQRVDAQWAWGKQKMFDALDSPEDDRGHIKKP